MNVELNTLTFQFFTFMNPETLVLKPRRHLLAENKDYQRIDQGLQSNVTPKKLTLDGL